MAAISQLTASPSSFPRNSIASSFEGLRTPSSTLKFPTLLSSGNNNNNNNNNNLSLSVSKICLFDIPTATTVAPKLHTLERFGYWVDVKYTSYDHVMKWNQFAAIRQVSLINTEIEDQLTLLGSANEVYSTSAGYLTAKQLLLDQWKLCNNIVASKDILLLKGVDVQESCEVCGDHTESIVHVFQECQWAMRFWTLLQIPGFSLSGPIIDWSLWLDYVFLMRTDVPLSLPGLPVVWRPPNDDSIKISFEASFSNATGTSHLGCVAQEKDGVILEAIDRCFGRVESTLIAEAKAALQGVWLAIRLQIPKVILEGDNQLSWKELSKPGRSFVDCGDIKREGNRVGHALASLYVFNSVFRSCVLPSCVKHYTRRQPQQTSLVALSSSTQLIVVRQPTTSLTSRTTVQFLSR
ncbi:hypothetical protein ACFE04_015515 [Oxalis oulophora]